MATASKLAPAPSREQPSRMYERHYSPAELAEMWSLSTDTVRRIFEEEPGVHRPKSTRQGRICVLVGTHYKSARHRRTQTLKRWQGVGIFRNKKQGK